MVDPTAGGMGAVPHSTQPQRADQARLQANRAALEVEQQVPERPPEPAGPLPRQASQPVPAEDLGTNIDLIA